MGLETAIEGVFEEDKTATYKEAAEMLGTDGDLASPCDQKK
jgi:hypothetical protein